MLPTATGLASPKEATLTIRPPLVGLLATLILTSLLLVACDRILGEEPTVIIPTQANITYEDVQTALPFTQNAPPPGFESVSFPSVDDNLENTVYSRFEINATFTGFYADNRELAPDAAIKVEIWNDELNVRRQVRLEFLGDVFSGGSTFLDVVRLGNDYYMIDSNGVCITNPEQVAPFATLTAGQLIGGVDFAQPSGRRDFINEVLAWQYGFDRQFINQPYLQLTESISELDYLTGELWISPENQVVVSYTIEMNVNRSILFFGQRPVTGRLRYQYDVFEIGQPPNISIPNGC